MHHAPCTMHHAPCTMHHAPCTMHHAPCTMHHAPHTHAPCTAHLLRRGGLQLRAVHSGLGSQDSRQLARPVQNSQATGASHKCRRQQVFPQYISLTLSRAAHTELLHPPVLPSSIQPPV